MKKFIFVLVFISLVSVQLLALLGSDNLKIIREKVALQLMRKAHHYSEHNKIHSPFRFNYEKKKEKATAR